MAITVNWATDQVINVPRADMPIIQVSPEVRELDVAQFWLDLKDLERTADGMPWPDTQTNNPSYIISGITYAQGFLIIPPYSITFEDGQYAVSLTGANNNIIDVANSNQVRILGNNSAGLIKGSITIEDLDNIIMEGSETLSQALRLIRAAAAGTINQAVDGSYAVRDAGNTKDRIEGDLGANNGRDITATDGT